MRSKVAVTRIVDGCYQKALTQAISMIGGIDDLNSYDKDVTIKFGIYDPKALNYPTLEATKAVVKAFDQCRRIFLAESNNHIGRALERLQVCKEVFDERVAPFDLSADGDQREAKILDEEICLSHVLYRPYVRVSFHAFRGLRGPGEILYGSALKNLLGVVPDIRKERFHRKLSIALLDLLETVGGMDLGILDATYTYYGKLEKEKPLDRVRTNLLIVGRDTIAVDAVGFALVGRNPLEIRTLAEAARRGLGQANLKKIEILGQNIETIKIEH